MSVGTTILGAIISSTVVSALVTGAFNNKAKRKELKMNANLQEKHEWITRISLSFSNYIQSINKYSVELSKCIVGTIKINELSPQVIIINNYASELHYYIEQVDYQSEYLKEVQNTLDEITKLFDKMWDSANGVWNNIHKRGIAIPEKDLMPILSDFEKDINKLSIQFSKNLGALVKEEKNSMIDTVLNSESI